jgi:hypothetical protein
VRGLPKRIEASVPRPTEDISELPVMDSRGERSPLGRAEPQRLPGVVGGVPQRHGTVTKVGDLDASNSSITVLCELLRHFTPLRSRAYIAVLSMSPPSAQDLPYGPVATASAVARRPLRHGRQADPTPAPGVFSDLPLSCPVAGF